MPPIDRRELLRYSAALAGTPMLYSSAVQGKRVEEGGDFFEPESEFFSTVSTEYASTVDTNSHGDLWPSCWADDDNVYAANGDGRGFGDEFSDIVMNRVHGTPKTGLSGERLAAGNEIGNIWGDPDEYRRKPTGMVAVDGNGDGEDELYVAVQDLRAPLGTSPPFDDAPNASISKSEDYGETWETTDEPMFTDYEFTTIMFLDYGKSQENAQTLGSDEAEYVYAYGLDYNWRDSDSNVVKDPTRLYLARVPKQSIQDRSAWEFYTGIRPNGDPTWSSDIDDRTPVLHDERRVYRDLLCDNRPKISGQDLAVISQGSVVYNEPLDRYIYTSWTWYTFEFYEAPEPWGPWKLFESEDFGATPWYGSPSEPDCPGLKEGGYTTTIPSKFISDDGKTMWIQSDTNFADARWDYDCGTPNYNFSLRKLEIEPHTHSVPKNKPDSDDNLAVSDEGTTPIEKTANLGFTEYYNDGKLLSEDSRDCEAKSLDFWGYTWNRKYNMDSVVYTTGNMFSDGGWFEEGDDGLRVQVRQDFEWIDVDGLSITPEYPYDDTAGPKNSYTISFRDTWGDGVRIIGPPGGSQHFTSIAELQVYYNDRGRHGRSHTGRGQDGRPVDDHKPPTRVTGLTADGGIREVSLSWEPAEDDFEVESYEVYGSRDPGFAITSENFVGENTITEFSHKNLGIDEQWYYRARAVDSSGNVGPASDEVSAATDPVFRIEGESLYPPLDASTDQVIYRQTTQFSADEWSGDAQLVLIPDGPGGYVTLEFDVPESATYELSAAFTKSFDYGIHVLSLDDESTGQSFDGYNRPLMRADPVSYGEFDLEAGTHTLTLTVTGKNPNSRGYRAGFDYMDLRLSE